MNESQAIVAAVAAAHQAGKTALLATVVRVQGSAYRSPGARMLLTEDGWQAGSISGGCLEGDILRKAWWRTRLGEPVVITYDSTVAEDAEIGEALSWGFGLGCNGIVEVLLEQLVPEDSACPVAFLADCLNQRRAGVLATVIAVRGEDVQIDVGQRLLWPEGETAPIACTLADTELYAAVEQDACRVLETGRSENVTYSLSGGGQADVFLEFVQPPTPLVICGAGHDVVPLARMAKALGWQVTVVDPRPFIAPRPDRFPDADAVLSCAPADLPARVALEARTFVVVMSHNVTLDADVLAALLPTPVRYIGALGPRRRTERILEYLRNEGRALPRTERIHGPVGLDIGADDPETIALSILAEIQAIRADRAGNSLRDREEPIHRPASENPTPRENAEPLVCTLTTTASAW